MRREPRKADGLPEDLADALRSGLTGLTEEICTEISTTIPDYQTPDNAPPAPETVVGYGLSAFVERISDPEAPDDKLAELFRMLGRKEAMSGRSLDSLHAAIRLAFRIAWHRTAEVCAQHRFSGQLVARLADLQLSYMDEVTGLSAEAYLGATAEPPAELAKLRRELLHTLVEQPRPPRATITELAEHVGWHVPEEATPVVVPPGTTWIRTVGDDDVLIDLDAAEPWLLIPGSVSEDRRTMLQAALPRSPVSVGLTMPLEELADSLRWARRVLALAEDGVVSGGRVLLTEEHLLTLWLTSDPALLDELVEYRLSDLMQVPGAKGEALTETLRVWLESWGTAGEVGSRLHVHPQTVRYRLHQLKETLGDRLDDPEARFGMELTLRAQRLRKRARSNNTSGRPSPAP